MQKRGEIFLTRFPDHWNRSAAFFLSIHQFEITNLQIQASSVLLMLIVGPPNFRACHQERLRRNQFGSCDCCCCVGVGNTANDCQISYIHLLSNFLRSLYYLLLYYWAIGIFTLLGNRNDPSKSNHFKFSRLLTRKHV